MDDHYDFDFESRQVDSSERTDSDGGGGTNFVFYDGSSGQKKGQGQSEDAGKEKKPIDFGEPVEVELSDAALQAEADADKIASGQENRPPRNPLVGRNIDIEV